MLVNYYREVLCPIVFTLSVSIFIKQNYCRLKEPIKILFKFRFAFLLTFVFLNSTSNILLAEESLLDFKIEEAGNLFLLNTDRIYFDNIEARLNSVNIKGVEINQKILTDSSQIFRWTAIEYAQNNEAEKASIYIDKYIKSTLHIGFINNDVFNGISNSEEFKVLESKYKTNLSPINLFYLFASLIGVFIFIVLNLKNNTNNISNTLISIFVLMHSVFILDLFFYLTNLKFSYPHTMLMSLTFSFLYGPIIYFYYKKIVLNYKFKWIDVLHFIPTLFIFIAALPYYLLSGQEKLAILLEVSSLSTKGIYDVAFIVKLTSLVIYALLIVRIYYKFSKNNDKLSIIKLKWQKGLAGLVSAYVVFYCIYGLMMVTKMLPRIDFLFHLQIVTMAIMVLYIGYKAFLTPKLFSSGYFDTENYKYKKSGLTNSFSEDLKEKLLYLLENEKIYRQNNISLEILSQRLDTTRHNTSQVINEHFGLNFFEIINKYRIEEARLILENDKQNNMNIIDVAYEVGFNNKVTFNKSFKKILSLTPTQYIDSLSV